MRSSADFTMDYFSLKGRNAVVTGGNSSLGKAFSLALAKAGANIFIPSLLEDNETETLIKSEGVGVESVKIDLTESGAAKKIIDGCVDAFGSIDILINNAGICKNVQDVLQFGRSEWDIMMAVNLTSPFELSYEAAKRMIPQRSGKIINICSLFSFLGGQWSPAYAASKHGLAGFTKAYCDELAQYNVQVNAIAPGYYATELTKETRSNPVTNQRILDHIPANRWGDASDLMGATVFLASRAADYVNGHILVVDGGYLVR